MTYYYWRIKSYSAFLISLITYVFDMQIQAASSQNSSTVWQNQGTNLISVLKGQPGSSGIAISREVNFIYLELHLVIYYYYFDNDNAMCFTNLSIYFNFLLLMGSKVLLELGHAQLVACHVMIILNMN